MVSKFQVCEEPVYSQELLTLLATGRQIDIYGGSTGVEAVVSGFKREISTNFLADRIGPYRCMGQCADSASRTRRLFLSSYATTTQQKYLDSVNKYENVNCKLNGMWCPTVCETKDGLLDEDGYTIRTKATPPKLAPISISGSSEFFLDVDYRELRPGKHYTVCAYFGSEEVSQVQNNSQFETWQGTRRVHPTPPLPEATVLLPPEVDFGDDDTAAATTTPPPQ